MKSFGKLWDKIVATENIHLAWRRVHRGRSMSASVREFERNLDANLEAIERQLKSGAYRHDDYRQFRITDPKPRMISCATVRDRVAHHAICNIIAPLLERRFVRNSYACRKGFGLHRACRHVRDEAKRHQWFLKLDIRHYFDSLDHGTLEGVLLPMFRERKLRDVLTQLIACDLPGLPKGKGIPIGNLTSQWFANLYLDGLDHFLVDELGIGNAYVRYMDDIVILADSKEDCWRYYGLVSDWLAKERGLVLKESATTIAPIAEGIPFLGLRIFGSCWRLSGRKFRHVRRMCKSRWKGFGRGDLDENHLVQSLVSVEGGVRWFGFKDIVNDQVLLEAEGGATSGSNRVNRGGSYNNNAQNCRSANRNNNSEGNSNNNLGFRPVSIRLVSGQAGSNSACPELRGAETNMQHTCTTSTLLHKAVQEICYNTPYGKDCDNVLLV